MKKKIIFLIESFAGGGVEKVFIDLINNMDISKSSLRVSLSKDNTKEEIDIFIKVLKEEIL